MNMRAQGQRKFCVIKTQPDKNAASAIESRAEPQPSAARGQESCAVSMGGTAFFMSPVNHSATEPMYVEQGRFKAYIVYS